MYGPDSPPILAYLFQNPAQNQAEWSEARSDAGNWIVSTMRLCTKESGQGSRNFVLRIDRGNRVIEVGAGLFATLKRTRLAGLVLTGTLCL